MSIQLSDLKGITCSVYRSAEFTSDCTYRGVTSRVNSVVLVDDALDKVFSASGERPAFRLIRRRFPSLGNQDYIHAVPYHVANPTNYMFGGNFIYTSDSRVSALNPYPIPVHDRSESEFARSRDNAAYVALYGTILPVLV